jgi:hypothetical protein
VIHLMKTEQVSMDNGDYPWTRVEAVGGQHDWVQLHPLEASQ